MAWQSGGVEGGAAKRDTGSDGQWHRDGAALQEIGGQVSSHSATTSGDTDRTWAVRWGRCGATGDR
eukprot:13427278-Alexandrium_andersonii.AAC.1